MFKNKRIKPFFGRGRKINLGHPIYVYKRKNNENYYLGLTHSPNTDGMNNYKLYKNPNPEDPRESYILYKQDSTSEKINKKYPHWRFDQRDRKLIKTLINKNKKS